MSFRMAEFDMRPQKAVYDSIPPVLCLAGVALAAGSRVFSHSIANVEAHRDMEKSPNVFLSPVVPTESKLLTIYDDFSEFDAYCSFFCDAVAALSRDEDDFLDRATAQGIRLFGDWLKEKSNGIKRELKDALATE
jgi:hypothetical protein